jgi:YHS domain-containing protein
MKRKTVLTALFAALFSVGAVTATIASNGPTQAPQQNETKPEEKPVCPVMKEEVEDVAGAAYSDYKGKRYYFCCPGCKPKFDKNPEKYVKPAEPKK